MTRPEWWAHLKQWQRLGSIVTVTFLAGWAAHTFLTGPVLGPGEARIRIERLEAQEISQDKTIVRLERRQLETQDTLNLMNRRQRTLLRVICRDPEVGRAVECQAVYGPGGP